MNTGASRRFGGPSRTLEALLLTALVCAGGALPASAQYFGRNKVQYDRFDFRTLQTQHFDLHFYGGGTPPAVVDAARMAERWYERFARTFQLELEERKPVVLYADKPDFQQTNAVPGLISEATGGVTESVKDRVVLPLAESYGETDHVIGHEFIHLFQYDLARGPRGGTSTSLNRVPLWMVEGLSEYLSLGRHHPQTAMWMRDAVRRDDLPTLDDLTRRPERYFPYRYGHAFWAYVAGRWDDATAVSLFRQTLRVGPYAAIRQVLGVGPDSLSVEWARATREHFGPLLEGRAGPAEAGQRLLAPETGAGEVILSPVVSPDGGTVAFFSEKDVFTFDLYLADARTGEIRGKLASADREPHFDALSFAGSAGAWSPDGRRFALVAVAEGDHRIAVADAGSRRLEHTLSVEPATAVYSLAWSPDGRTIAFSGSREGVTDLFLLSLETGEVHRLTDDRYTELHPDWSPDGRILVFSTDRGGPDGLERLDLPAHALGFVRPGEAGGVIAAGRSGRADGSVETVRLREAGGTVEAARAREAGETMAVARRREAGETIEVVHPFEGATHTNPRFAPDGRSVYFIADPDGVPDVYRMDLETGELWRVTRLASGASGLSPLAPALSVARESGRMLFTMYEEGGYVGYALDGARAQGEPTEAACDPRAPAGMLPPDGAAPPGYVERYLADPTTGLPSGREFEVRDYRASLGLDYVAPPTVGVSMDRFGTAVGGSVGAWFSDMLGNRELVLLLQGGGELQDIGGGVLYGNRKRRTNWQVGALRIPWLTSYATVGTGTIDGQPARVVDYVLSRTYVSQLFGGVEYPLSSTRRLEAQGGYLGYGFDRESIRYWVVGGRVVREERIDLDAPASLDFARGSVAWVGDHSFFGFTSPVRGGRSRLELGAYTGSLDFFTVLADGRRYAFRNPLTLAFRGLHYGRFGPDAGSDRIGPVFLGQATFVRGYDPWSFEGGECTPVPDDPGACPEWDRLVGTRIGVVNLELRLPLLGSESFGLIPFPYLPTEIALFGDAGVAWTAEEPPELRLERRSSERIPVFSTGVTARINLFGQLVMEIYYAHPFQRPIKGGHFGFQFAPGW